MAQSEQPSGKPTRVRWGILSLALSTSWLLYLHRYLFSFIKPTLAEKWKLSNTELGELDSAFSFCYTAFQFPFGIAADALGVHLVLCGLILVWCLGLGIMTWAASARWMWCGLATLGTGQSAVYACLNRVANMWYPPGIRTTLQGAVGVLAGRLGALSSSLLFSTLLLGMLGLDWRTAAGILLTLGVGQLLLFALVFRNSPRQHPGVNELEVALIEGFPATKQVGPAGAATSIGVGRMLRRMTPRSLANLTWLNVQAILSTIADNIYSNWIPAFLAQVHHLEFKKMGLYAALPLLGGALGGLLGGLLNDVLISLTGNRRWSRAGVAMAGKGMAAVMIFAALLFYDRPYLFCAMLFLVKLFGDWSLTSQLGVLTDI